MIIYDKIKNRYNKDEIYELFPRITARNIIFERNIVKAGVLVKFISFDEINYTLDDFISDYQADKKYKEVHYVYKILNSGKNIGQLARENGMTDQLSYLLKQGMDFNSEGLNLYKLIDIFNIDIDIKKIKIDIYDTHVEFFGEKERLQTFKENFAIKHPVLFEPLKKNWHIAFDGMLAEYIQKSSFK